MTMACRHYVFSVVTNAPHVQILRHALHATPRYFETICPRVSVHARMDTLKIQLLTVKNAHIIA